MKKSGIVSALMLLFALALGAAGAWADSHQLVVTNASKDTVRVNLLWSGGGVSQIKIAPGGSNTSTIASAVESVKVTANGKCREAVETFDPQRVDQVRIDCKGDTYTLKLEQMKPAP